MPKDNNNGSAFDALRRIGNQTNTSSRPIKKSGNTRPINEGQNQGTNHGSNNKE